MKWQSKACYRAPRLRQPNSRPNYYRVCPYIGVYITPEGPAINKISLLHRKHIGYYPLSGASHHNDGGMFGMRVSGSTPDPLTRSFLTVFPYSIFMFVVNTWTILLK